VARGHAGGEAARLQDEDRLAGEERRCRQRQRHARRLAGARRRLQHKRAVPLQLLEDARDQRFDRKIGHHRLVRRRRGLGQWAARKSEPIYA
jgi:hypothetical protein